MPDTDDVVGERNGRRRVAVERLKKQPWRCKASSDEEGRVEHDVRLMLTS